MKEHRTLKIDMAFKGLVDKELVKLLDSGWKIIDKTIERERYIYYVLSNNFDPDIGTCSYSQNEIDNSPPKMVPFKKQP